MELFTTKEKVTLHIPIFQRDTQIKSRKCVIENGNYPGMKNKIIIKNSKAFGKSYVFYIYDIWKSEL